MPEGVQKVFQPNRDGPDDKIVVERVPEARHFYVYHDGGDGERVGRVEVTPAYQATAGTFDSGEPLMTWMIGPHLTGYKYKKEFRIRAELLADSLTDEWGRYEHSANNFMNAVVNDMHPIDVGEVDDLSEKSDLLSVDSRVQTGE